MLGTVTSFPRIKVSPRQKLIFAALTSLGGDATIAQIAAVAELNVNGLSQTLSHMTHSLEYVAGRGGQARWRVKQPTDRWRSIAAD